MRKLLLSVLFVLVSVALCSAQSLRVGAHGAYATGGNLWSSAAGYGVQIEGMLNKYIGIEISGTKFTDEDTWDEDSDVGRITWDNTTLAATLKLGLPVAKGVFLYGGGGASYLMVDAKEEVTFWGEELDIEVDVDDTIGYHVCGGIEAHISERISLFAEYRYNYFDDVKLSGVEDGDVFEEGGEYKFSLIRAGLNLILL